MNTKIKSICLKSVLKTMPLIYFILSLVLGLASYIYANYRPGGVAPRINVFDWISAIFVYAILFSLIFSIISLVSVILYNKLNHKLGSVEVSLEHK